MPSTVGFAFGLLYLQASIWGLLCVGAVVWAASAPAYLAVLLAVGTVAGAIAGAKAWLARRIPRGSDRTRQWVVAVECVMAGLGALLTLPLLIPEGGGVPALACLVGGGLSLRAAIWLSQPPARQYFARPGSEGTPAISRPGNEGGAPYWRLAPRFPVASA
jgi:hypothetical protein